MMIQRYHQHHHSLRDGQRKVSPPGPSYMSDDQFANYLKDLRTNRPLRPSGSRPLPSKPPGSTAQQVKGNSPPRASSAMSSYAVASGQPVESAVEEGSPPRASPPRATSAMSHYRSSPSRMSYGSSAGRPLVQEPKTTEPRTIPIRKNISPPQIFSRPISVSPNAAYKESDQRRMEKEEARSLRDALEGVDLHDDVHLHQAAQDEATELVWMHQNPGVPYKNPGAPYRNPDIEKRGQSPDKTNRSPSQYRGFRKNFMSSPRRNSPHSASDSSSDGPHGLDLEDSPGRQSQTDSNGEGFSPKRNSLFRKNLKVNFALPSEETSSTPAVDTNGTNKTTFSSETSKGIFRNPNDQIYEEPEESQSNPTNDRPDFSRSDSSALRNRPRNIFPRGSRPLPSRFGSLSFVDKLAKFDLHKNSQTQSRNPEYTVNEPITQPDPVAKAAEEETVQTKDGLEIRGDDIRAATSKKRTDRSSNLPMPSAVSDRTGRPIVSFDPTWKPTEAASPGRNCDNLISRESSSPTPPPTAPTIQVSDAPTIQVSEAPSIQVSEAPSIPVINLPDNKEPTISEIEASSRPLPEPTRDSSRRPTSPRKQPAAPQNRWYTPYTRAGVPTAKCESCTLPIAGKIVTAAGSRFHPECFVCSHCQTPLECIGFYQEPETKRNERLAQTPVEDEEARAVRFYCHLDFHELFSPRCKSCKTPIEGEVVVACGSEWHVGHFFCAECGDPFDSQTPFVEKDSFAWCLQCYSRRTAPKCMGCKKPVQEDLVISAIGGQWHDECFNCHECGHGFGPNGRFFVREGEPKRTAKGRIIGGPVQLAICEDCESIRLKSASPRY